MNFKLVKMTITIEAMESLKAGTKILQTQAGN